MAPSAHSTGDAPRWQDVTPQALWPCTGMYFLSYVPARDHWIWAYIWQRSSDGMYSWQVTLNPQEDSPFNYNAGWTYDTFADAVHFLMEALERAAGYNAPSFPRPSFFGRLPDAAQEGGEVTE